ncbi:hypothetical protein Pyn_30779 [Prunus yedoensis var. nudiflora]|uniref:Uncharacterized protein n=1 Tax=Prunus yedoensis var. nudiflora TaxID=2094558 RepID=A0A314Y398_PRUYE|nr:hypothetical protein Pyn_30779 [Prunus yedoensis var. nudiflora]
MASARTACLGCSLLVPIPPSSAPGAATCPSSATRSGPPQELRRARSDSLEFQCRLVCLRRQFRLRLHGRRGWGR